MTQLQTTPCRVPKVAAPCSGGCPQLQAELRHALAPAIPTRIEQSGWQKIREEICFLFIKLREPNLLKKHIYIDSDDELVATFSVLRALVGGQEGEHHPTKFPQISINRISHLIRGQCSQYHHGSALHTLISVRQALRSGSISWTTSLAQCSKRPNAQLRLDLDDLVTQPVPRHTELPRLQDKERRGRKFSRNLALTLTLNVPRAKPMLHLLHTDRFELNTSQDERLKLSERPQTSELQQMDPHTPE